MLDAIVFLVNRFIDWLHNKNIYYIPYTPNILGEHNETTKDKTY